MEIREAIQSRCRGENHWNFAVAMLRAASVTLALGLLLQIADWLFGLWENFAAWVGMVPVVLGAFCLLRHYRVCHIQEVLKAIEGRHPQLMDALSCAVELEAKGTALNSVEEQLLRNVCRRLEVDSELAHDIHTPRHGLPAVLAVYLLAALLLCGAAHLPSMTKCACGWRSMLGMLEPGIVLLDCPMEVAVHSDLRLQAELRRWDSEADIVYASGNAKCRCPMNCSGGRAAFSFYDVTEELRFRIVSRSLRSPWRRIRVYVPPTLLSASLDVLPQDYMERQPRHFDSLADMEVMEGESIRLTVAVPEGVRPVLAYDGTQYVFTFAGASQVVEFSPAKTGQAKLTLRDAVGHESIFTFGVEVTPDMPPVISLLEPMGDVYVKPGDGIRTMITASDDNGLASLKILYSVNGGERREFVLEKNDRKPWDTEWEVNRLWNLADMDLKIGDMLCCMVVGEDNFLPQHHSSRSDLFFVALRPSPENVEMDVQQGQQGAEGDVSDLIAESKRLLRLTWDVLPIGDARGEVAEGLGGLAAAVKERVAKFGAASNGNLGEPYKSLFATAEIGLANALKLVERELFEESISQQEKALTALVALETEMIKNSIKSAKAKEGQGEGASQDQKEEGAQKQQEQQQKQESKADLSAMKKMLDKLRQLLERQSQLNEKLLNEDALLPPLAAIQKGILSEAERCRRELGKMPGAEVASASLEAAEHEMRSGSTAMTNNERQVAGIHGKRAKMHLLAALQAMEEALKKASGNAVAQLAELADNLSQAQRQEAEKSADNAKGGANGPEAKAARERQQALNERTEELGEQLKNAANELAEQFPEIADGMRGALTETMRQGLQRAQSRAKNALLYKRFDKASKEQQDAANYLKSLANALYKSAESMPSLDVQDLRNALEELRKAGEKIQSGMRDEDGDRGAQRIQEASAQAAEAISRIAEASGNVSLQDASDALSGTGTEEPAAELGAEALKSISDAGSIIGQMMDRMLREKNRTLLKKVAPPPERYRRQVEEYFRKIIEK